MVADSQALSPRRSLSPKKAKFAALIAEGATQQAAYRAVISPHCTKNTAEVEGSRMALRPEVREEIERIRQASWTDRVLVMQERRALLGDIARKGAKAKPSASDAIAAVREDAILAGERRTDGTQVVVNGDVSVSLVLQSLRGGLAPAIPAAQDARAVPVDVAAVPVGIDEPAARALPAPVVPAPASAPTLALGPLGRVR